MINQLSIDRKYESKNINKFSFDLIPTDLQATQNLVYDLVGFNYSQSLIDLENAKYGGCTFTVNDLHIRFRVAKITPKKIGQFVTLWQRVGKSPAPFDVSDSVDFFVISVRNENFF